MASTYLTCATNQLIETIAVFAANLQAPLKNAALTGLFNNSANYWQFPDNASNQLLAQTAYIDCDNTVPGNIVFSETAAGPVVGITPSPIGNLPIPADAPFGTPAYTITTFQMCEIIAVLAKNLIRPFAWNNQTGLFLNGANQIQFPDNAYNQLLGNNCQVYGDGVWLYVQQTTIGEPGTGS
jgi:hypothetical protein